METVRLDGMVSAASCLAFSTTSSPIPYDRNLTEDHVVEREEEFRESDILRNQRVITSTTQCRERRVQSYGWVCVEYRYVASGTSRHPVDHWNAGDIAMIRLNQIFSMSEVKAGLFLASHGWLAEGKIPDSGDLGDNRVTSSVGLIAVGAYVEARDNDGKGRLMEGAALRQMGRRNDEAARVFGRLLGGSNHVFGLQKERSVSRPYAQSDALGHYPSSCRDIDFKGIWSATP